MNELLRRCMQYRTRKNEPCKVLLGVHSNAEVTREMPPVMDSEPMPLATICDFGLRVPKEVGAAPARASPTTCRRRACRRSRPACRCTCASTARCARPR